VHGKNHPGFIPPISPAPNPAPRRLVAGIAARARGAVCEIAGAAKYPITIKTSAQNSLPHPRPFRDINMSIAATSELETAPARPLAAPLSYAAGLVALADWLFYGWHIGISLALFLGALGVAAILSNRVQLGDKSRIVAVIILIAGFLPLIEEVNLLSAIVATVTTASSIIAMTSPRSVSWPKQLFETATVPFRGPFLLARDTIGALRHMKVCTPGWLGWLVGWIVPLLVFAIFLTLFSSANPLIEQGLLKIDLRKLFEFISPWRSGFWVFVGCMIWPLIYRRIKPRSALIVPSAPAEATTKDFDFLLGAQAMTRSLVLFNALFALQSTLDLTYLWGGAVLPDGMTYAQYAHRGAYPLIITALLAAAFVLVAMRPGGPAEKSRLIRPLVLAFIAQNILLVISSIFRLDLYIATYSLTYTRLVAFVWMGLVAAGLMLILVQIVLRKSIYWLITANAIMLALVLYGCCLINAPWLIASYNVEHSRQVSGTGQSLDYLYLRSLGPQALPALDRHREELPTLWVSKCSYCSDGRETFVASKNWRDWSFRAWRLERYFANNPMNAPSLSTGGKG
jgi:hypothetical protein